MCRWRLVAAARRRLRRGAEDGQSLVELTVAMTVLSVAVIGVVGTMGLGVTLTGGSRQRSAGSGVANERLERARNVPYSRVATYEQPAHSTDVNSPDYNVSTDNTSYKVTSSTIEPLIVDTTNGALKHIDDPITVGNTQFSIYQYVTWVDDPQITGTQDYKRVIVVVTWKYPVASGVTHSLTTSTFVSNGIVQLPNVTPPPASPTPTPAPTASPPPTPTPTPAEACSGDVTGPTGSMSIVSGTGAQTGYTNSTTTQVTLTATDSCSPITAWLSNTNGNFTNAGALTTGVPSTATWTIPSGDGTKTVYAQFTDGKANPSAVYSATVTLDKTVPTVPGSLRKSTCSISGTNRILNMTWNASSDTNFLRYNVYRQLNGATYTALGNAAGASFSDTTKKTDAVAYTVRAYDKAGNESGDSNVLSFAKNNC